MSMNLDIKSDWVEALRSGNYKQSTTFLKTDEGFCCLGVLCDLHSKATGEGSWKGTFYVLESGDYSDEILPDAVRKWAGLERHNPSVLYAVDLSDTVSELNDSGTTFSRIADLIEAQL